MKRIALLIPLLFTGCLAKELRAPAAEHAEQTGIVATRCALDYYERPCPVELQLDLEETAKQAAKIQEIVETGAR